jgi:hypothetical protein
MRATKHVLPIRRYRLVADFDGNGCADEIGYPS